MAPRRSAHRVVCLGVPSASRLEYVEDNARAVHRVLSGALAPADTEATCLVGAGATKDAVTAALDRLRSSRGRPNYFFLYFAGKASAKGLHVADGCVSPDALLRTWNAGFASPTLVVLELVAGPAPDADLLPRWVEAWTKARECVRVAASRATRIGGAEKGAGLGRFTHALVDALETAEGDMDFDGARYISDKRALDEAGEILKRRWRVTHEPQRVGPFGDFPLARCQTSAPVGGGAVLGASAGANIALSVRYSLEGRKHLPTLLSYVLEDASGVAIAEGKAVIVPEEDRVSGRHRIRFPVRVLSDHEIWGPTLSVGERVHVRWRITLRDARGRTFDQKVYGHEYGQFRSARRRR